MINEDKVELEWVDKMILRYGEVVGTQQAPKARQDILDFIYKKIITKHRANGEIIAEAFNKYVKENPANIKP